MRVENSFIPVYGVGEITEQKLWQSGVVAWEEFDGSVVGPTKAERIEEFIDAATTELDNDNATYFKDVFPSQSYWRLYENFRDQTCFIDIETTGLSICQDTTTVVSLHQGDETTSLVRGMNLSQERLRRELQDSKLLVTFNGKQFDIPFLNREFDVEVNVPHIDLRYACRKLDLVGGLKEIERTLGIPRSHSDIEGWEAVRLWRQYERGDVGSLNKLVAYNREDTQNLRSIMDTVAEELHKSVFESVLDPE